jgi:hypothetical protein
VTLDELHDVVEKLDMLCTEAMRHLKQLRQKQALLSELDVCPFEVPTGHGATMDLLADACAGSAQHVKETSHSTPIVYFSAVHGLRQNLSAMGQEVARLRSA